MKDEWRKKVSGSVPAEDESREGWENFHEKTSSKSSGCRPAIPKPAAAMISIHSIHEIILRQNVDEFDALNLDGENDIRLLEQRDQGGRTPLHICLLFGFPDMLEKLFTAADDASTKLLKRRFRTEKDDLPPLHLALSMAPFAERVNDAERCIDLLLNTAKRYGMDIVGSRDGYDKEALHYACDFGRPSIVKKLLEAGAHPMARDSQDQMPLHFAIDSFDIDTLQIILPLTDVQKSYSQFHPVLRCIRKGNWHAVQQFYHWKWLEDEDTVTQIGAYASRHGMGKHWHQVLARARSHEEIESQQECARTALITHAECFNHLPIPQDCDDPELRFKLMDHGVENPHRLEVITGQYGALRADEFQRGNTIWRENAAECTMEDILRVHEDHYIYHTLIGGIEKLTKSASRSAWISFDASDTNVSKESLVASRRAAGCVVEGVDLVMNTQKHAQCGGDEKERIRNAFCALRPPGHHCGPAGALDPLDVTKDDANGSQGFCLLNNVAIGAAYALNAHRNVCEKVAIIDFDVHHGNGTEAICRNCVEGRGARNYSGESGEGLSKAGPAKPWCDATSDRNNIFFASIHGFGEGFYPGSGHDSHLKPPECAEIINVGVAPGTGSRDLRRKFHSRIIPHLINFNPDLIFISAGFDGHSNDLIGCCQFIDEDYVWMTQELMKVANQCCNGRIVSVLEGGYNTRAGVLSPFASSIRAHVRTLMHSSDALAFEEGLEDELETEWNENYVRQWSKNERFDGDDNDMLQCRHFDAFPPTA